MAYSGGTDVHKDSGPAYDSPQWNVDNSNQYPYLYTQGQKLTVTAYWDILPGSILSSSDQIKVKGTATDGFDIGPVKADIDLSAKKIWITSASAKDPFPAKTKSYGDNGHAGFTIDWKISCDGGRSWHPAGTSQNPIYVSLAIPGEGIAEYVTAYRTVCHLACYIEDATTAGEAFMNTWAMFSINDKAPKNVNAWNETDQSWSRKLYYYKAGTHPSENVQINENRPDDTAALLLQSPNDSGQCSAWACLMRDAVNLNGAGVVYTLTHTGDKDHFPRFLVKDWTWINSPPPIFKFNNSVPDMVPIFLDDIYGAARNEDTLLGQNSERTRPVRSPSQKVFVNHQFLYYGDMINGGAFYDPSYGTKYDDKDDFIRKAVWGYGTPGAPIKGKFTIFVSPPGKEVSMRFIYPDF